MIFYEMKNVGSFPIVMSTVGKGGEQYGCETLQNKPGNHNRKLSWGEYDGKQQKKCSNSRK